jgi:hypothetical protein
MAILRPTRSVGTLILAVYLIAVGIAGLIGLAIPAPVLPLLALLAGILMLVGR